LKKNNTKAIGIGFIALMNYHRRRLSSFQEKYDYGNR